MPDIPAQEKRNFIEVDGQRYGALEILIQKRSLEEQMNHRKQDVRDFFKLFENFTASACAVDEALVFRLSRLAGTSLLEAAYLLKSLSVAQSVTGDWCEYGVAHGRTSALLAQVMLRDRRGRQLWLYDSFEGLPRPHEKDVLLNDIFAKGSIENYEGEISIPEEYVRQELLSVSSECDYFRIQKGWITKESLESHSPEQIGFAYLDMDFYQSTYDVLEFLTKRMPAGGIALVDDYGVFSDGVRAAVQEILERFPGTFRFEQPFSDKFAILTRI